MLCGDAVVGFLNELIPARIRAYTLADICRAVEAVSGVRVVRVSVCGADFHHYPHQHVGLHAPQRLRRLPQDCKVRVWSRTRANFLTRPPVSSINRMKLSAYFAALTAA